MAADADALVLLDGDLGATAAEAGTLLEPVLAGAADMTIATLPKPPASGGFGLVKGLARWGIRRLSGFEPTAPLSGQRALSRAAWEAATPFATGYGVEVGLTVRAARAGMRLLEVPTNMAHAATGRDLAGFTHRACRANASTVGASKSAFIGNDTPRAFVTRASTWPAKRE